MTWPIAFNPSSSLIASILPQFLGSRQLSKCERFSTLSRWIDAPPEYGPKKTLYNRYVRWAAKGVWIDLFHALAKAGGPPSQVLIDSSAVKAHRSAAGGKGGRKIRPSAARAVGARQKSTR